MTNDEQGRDTANTPVDELVSEFAPEELTEFHKLLDIEPTLGTEDD